MGRLVEAQPRKVAIAGATLVNAADPHAAIKEYGERVAKYVPGEVLAVYASAVQLISTKDAGTPVRLWLFAAVAALCAIITPMYLGRFSMPETIVTAAIEDDVDVIGLSCHSWEYLYYLDELTALLDQQQLRIPVVIGGSVITQGDKRSIKGVAAAFGPTATAGEIVGTIQGLATRRND